MKNVRQMSKVKAVYNSFFPEIVDGNSKTKFSFFPAYIYTCFTFTLHSTALLKYIIEIDSNFVCKIIENNLSKKIKTEMFYSFICYSGLCGKIDEKTKKK